MSDENRFLMQVETALNDVRFNNMTPGDFEHRVRQIINNWHATLPRNVPLDSVPPGTPVVYGVDYGAAQMADPKRIETSDVEIIAAAIKAMEDHFVDHANVNDYDVQHVARNIVHELTKPLEKVSDITGFPEDHEHRHEWPRGLRHEDNGQN